jgi:hypothetical protein
LGSIWIYTSDAYVGATFKDSYYLKDDTVKIGTSSSTSSSGTTSSNDNSSTSSNVSNSVADNIKTLKNYISQNGSTNSDGNKYISYTDSGFTSSIVYIAQSDVLKFTSENNTSTLSIVMSSANNTATLEADYFWGTATTTALRGTCSLEPTTYTSNQTITFTFTEGSYLSDETMQAKYQQLCNKALTVGFTGWELVLLTNLGMDLKNIGFTSYSI